MQQTNLHPRTKNILLVASVLFAALALITVTLLLVRPADKRTGGGSYTVKVVTNLTPVTLLMDGQSSEITGAEKTLTLPDNKSHTYQASATVENNKVTLSGTLTAQNNKELNLDFQQFTRGAIVAAVCDKADFSGDCLFTTDNSVVSVVEDGRWSVVVSRPAGLEAASTVLRIDGGRWKIIDGPGTDITTGGYYPVSVERILQDVN